MSKFIDADKLTAEITAWRNKQIGFSWDAVNEVLEIVSSIQWERPSLPSNLDEAADAYSENVLANGEDMFDAIADGFRAGAEWMAEQGKTEEAVIGMATEKISIIVSKQTLNELNLCLGDKVVVQIRKEGAK